MPRFHVWLSVGCHYQSQAYAQAMNLMQKLLGLKPKLTARDLCIQFGWASGPSDPSAAECNLLC